MAAKNSFVSSVTFCSSSFLAAKKGRLKTFDTNYTNFHEFNPEKSSRKKPCFLFAVKSV
jgi:hypothetical protein